MNKKLAILLCVTFLTVLIAGNLYAQRHSYWSLHKLSDELNLTKEQRDKIADIRIKYEKERISLESDLKKIRLDTTNLLKNIDKNLTEIESMYNKMANIRVKMKMSHLKQKIETKNILTDKQKEKLEEIIKDKKHKFGFCMDRHSYFGKLGDVHMKREMIKFKDRMQDFECNCKK